MSTDTVHTVEQARETHVWQYEAATAEEPVKLRVARGTQIAHEGNLYEAGKTLEAPAGQAEAWIASGIAERVGR